MSEVTFGKGTLIFFDGDYQITISHVNLSLQLDHEFYPDFNEKNAYRMFEKPGPFLANAHYSFAGGGQAVNGTRVVISRPPEVKKFKSKIRVSVNRPLLEDS